MTQPCPWAMRYLTAWEGEGVCAATPEPELPLNRSFFPEKKINGCLLLLFKLKKNAISYNIRGELNYSLKKSICNILMRPKYSGLRGASPASQ